VGNDTFAPKVLHVLDHSLPLHSGFAFRSQNILRCQRDLGWQLYAVTSIKYPMGLNNNEMSCEDEQIGGIRFYRSNIKSRMMGEYLTNFQVVSKLLSSLKRIIAIEHPDVLHVQPPALNVLPPLILRRKLRIPVVCEIRAFWGNSAVDHGTYPESSWKYNLVHALETRACRRVKHLAVLCEDIKQDLQKRGIGGNHISVVPNGIRAEDFQPCPADEEFRHDWGIKRKALLN
jgi:glycosyltransferase involved in cell wall biosynthesis